MDSRTLSRAYERAHDLMRSIDGLQPQEAFDELLKYLFFKECAEEEGDAVALEPMLQRDGLFRFGDDEAVHVIRGRFRSYITEKASWAHELWPDGSIRLSGEALLAVHSELSQFAFSDAAVDIRSAALRTFLTPEIRRGLGIFLTPDDVVRMMIEVAAPRPNDVVLDPACGAGTFLAATVRYWRGTTPRQSKFQVFGIDKSPRMLMLAELNLGHSRYMRFNGRLSDALAPVDPEGDSPLDLKPNSVDVILTNPPFGVSVDLGTAPFSHFREAYLRARIPSEILFVEQCLRLLKPSGTLGIVLPRSVLTNRGLTAERKHLDSLGYLSHVIALPPETFSLAGTQTTTVAAFFRKYPARNRPSTVRVTSVTVSNVGHDSTGRPRAGNQLPKVAELIRQPDGAANDVLTVDVFPDVPADESLQRATYWLTGTTSDEHTATLADLVALACTGRTPARSAYTDDGMFILKVGNLTGHGINWNARDRNFVSQTEANKRLRSPALILKPGDIVLTAAAHSPRYIAKKVDILDQVPEALADGVTFVGEVLLLRCKPDVDPYVLLAFLRLDSTRDRIQRMIRGQTAHLDPKDLTSLPVPQQLIEPTAEIREVANLLREETRLAFALGELGVEQRMKATAAFLGV